MRVREEHELPLVSEQWGWKYHHLGIPTTLKLPGEQYIAHLKFYVSGFSSSPFGIEWMRFDSDCPLDKLIQTVPHLAFEVQNIDSELAAHNFHILSPPNSPAKGIRVVMVAHNGAPVELIEFDINKIKKTD
jgi:hypothetical protein